MMKNVLQLGLVLFLLSGKLPVGAQQIIHEELFNGSLGSWSVYDVEGPQTWMPDSYNGDEFAEMNGWDNGNVDNEDWLISPPLDLDQSENEILSFETAASFDGPDLELLYSTDYDGSSDPSANGTWEDLTAQASWSGGDYEIVQSGAIDLSGVSGTSVYLAFRYTSSAAEGATLWQVDSIVVIGETSVSAGVPQPDAITQPLVLDDQLQFEVANGSQVLELSIVDLSGRMLQSYPSALRQGLVRLPLNGLPTGIYVLMVNSTRGGKGYRFIR